MSNWCKRVLDPEELHKFDRENVVFFRKQLEQVCREFVDHPEHLEIEIRLGNKLPNASRGKAEWSILKENTSTFNPNIRRADFDQMLEYVQSRASSSATKRKERMLWLADGTRVAGTEALCKTRLLDIEVSLPHSVYDVRVSISYEEPRDFEFYNNEANRAYNRVLSEASRERTSVALNQDVVADFTLVRDSEEKEPKCIIELEVCGEQAGESLDTISQEIVKNIRLARYIMDKSLKR